MKDKTSDASIQTSQESSSSKRMLVSGKLLSISHTPIIIDGGSASLEFLEDHFEFDDSTQTYRSIKSDDTPFRTITEIEILDKNPIGNGQFHSCVRADAEQPKTFQVMVQCEGRDFVIRDVVDDSGVIEIEFSSDEFPTVNPSDPAHIKFKNPFRHIKALLVLELPSGKVLHNCNLVPQNGNCQIRIHYSD